MRRSRHVIVCLAGTGVGPELIAEASRALHGVSALHRFAVDDVHVPFGTEALARVGNPLPHPTRSAYLGADAILVADAQEPTLRQVESELDLRAIAVHTRLGERGSTVVAPLAPNLGAWAVERAFRIARSSRGQVTSVDEDTGFRRLVDETAERHHTILVEHLSAAEALQAMAVSPERFDVVVTTPLIADTLQRVGASVEAGIVAHARLAENGPSVFGAPHPGSADIAGQGVVDPSSILLAAALMLSEGLGERAAGETLAGAVAAVRLNSARRNGHHREHVVETTRELTDAVLELLPHANRNAEFYVGAVQ